MPKIIPPFSDPTDRGYKFLKVFDQYFAARGGRLVLNVEGGIPPYDWALSGGGTIDVWSDKKDFTGYTEVDSGGDIVVTANKIDVTTMLKDETSWVVFDYGASYLVGDFTQRIKVVATAGAGVTTAHSAWAWTNIATGGFSRQDFITNNDALEVWLQWESTTPEFRIGILDHSTDDSDFYSLGNSPPYTLYIELTRFNNLLTADIFTNSDYTGSIALLSITCGTGDMRYHVPVSSREIAGVGSVTYSSEDFIVLESAAVFTLDEVQTNVQYNFLNVDEDTNIDDEVFVGITDANSVAAEIKCKTCNPVVCESDPEYVFELLSITPDTLPLKCRNAKVCITGGCPPFHWEDILGTIEFQQEYTNGPCNTFRCIDFSNCTVGCLYGFKVTDNVGELILGCSSNPSLNEILTPSTIAPDSTIEVWITGGVAPFIWSNPGNGYSWASPTTTGNSNELTCDPGVCGVAYDCFADFTVEDACENTVDIQIRNTCGAWVSASPWFHASTTCGSSSLCMGAANTRALIIGKERWLFWPVTHGAHLSCDCNQIESKWVDWYYPNPGQWTLPAATMPPDIAYNIWQALHNGTGGCGSCFDANDGLDLYRGHYFTWQC